MSAILVFSPSRQEKHATMGTPTTGQTQEAPAQSRTEHILKCPSESTMKQLEKAIEELDHWLEAATTHPQLLKDIINGLTHWHNQIPGCQPYTKGVNSKATSGQYRLGTTGISLEIYPQKTTLPVYPQRPLA